MTEPRAARHAIVGVIWRAMSTKRRIIVAGGGLAALHAAVTLAQQTQQPGGPPLSGGYGPGHMYMWGSGWGLFWMMPLMMLFFFFVCVLVLWALFGRRHGAHQWGRPWHMGYGWDRGPRDPTRSALQILNERYARGEIQKAEYEERKATILSSRDS